MTVTAGFVVRDGVLLCADTLFSDGYTKQYRDKIFVHPLRGALVTFAIAGNASIAEMAIEECRSDLPFRPSKVYTITGIRRAIGTAIKRCYEGHVMNRPADERPRYDFSLLVAILTKKEPVRLFQTEGTSIAPVARYACGGIGRDLAYYIAASSYTPEMTADQAAAFAIRILAATKWHVDGVGGRSQFVAIQNGVVSPVVPYDIETAENSIADYEQMMSRLLIAIGSSGTDERFLDQLQFVVDHVQSMRKSWLASGSPWQALADSFRHTLKPQPKRPTNQPGLRPRGNSTRGRKSPPPSQA